MLITLKMLLQALLLPPGGPLLVAAAGACLIGLHRGVGARRAGWALLIASLATLWLLATPAVASALTEAVQRYPALDLERPVQAQAIVILGGGEARPSAPEYGGAPAAAAGLLERVAYGAFVARHTGLPILVSGEYREAIAMRASLARDFQLEPRWVEERSRDTFQNAQFSAPILKAAGVSRIILVTDAAHEWRAAHEFTSAGLIVVPAPEGMWLWHGSGPRRYLPYSAALDHSRIALHEFFGELARRALATLDLRRQAS
jgi:uncharacterized SAM-binding protein YcdF (DUF218 family)